MPLARRHTVALVAFPGAQILDITGPAAVFTTANRELGREHYAVRIVSSSGEPARTSAAITLATEPLTALGPRAVDTLLIAGGEQEGIVAAIADRKLRAWVKRTARQARRFGSVCSGTFVLASYGLLDERRAATHWNACQRLAERFPRVSVDADALYVVDGNVWTSAGVTTGIDMCLAMVQQDLGASVAHAVARQLVVYARRPGYQTQFSSTLRAQGQSDSPYAGLCAWLSDNLNQDLGVAALAAQMGQSPRDFHRKFLAAMGQSPARFVEELRLEQARLLLSHQLSLKEIAARTGFGGAVRLSRAFERRYGVRPSLFRQVH
ncbi:MAG: helix-turn-helix domain-containing protein [Myxococcales bacterium]|nr:MAG: helix-turn-helix domain-containing protein [Myxococcales bacterium]